MPPRFLVILNPAARGGRNRAIRPVLEAALHDAGLDAQVVETTSAGDAERLAREARSEIVVAAGGDGTVHEVVNGLDGPTLGVLPLGTGNDFARALGVPGRLAEAVAALAVARPAPIDLGHVWWEEEGPEGLVRWERRFANCLGMGFDAHAAHLAQETKWIGGRAAYLAAVLRTLWAWRRPIVHARVALTPARAVSAARPAGGPAGGLPGGLAVEEAEVVLDGPLFLCEVGNGPSMGGGFLITPDARLDDGVLDVCLVSHITLRRALRLLPLTFTGAHVDAPEVRMARAGGIEVEVQSGVLALQVDGEAVTFAARRVGVHVLPHALRALAPGL